MNKIVDKSLTKLGNLIFLTEFMMDT